VRRHTEVASALLASLRNSLNAVAMHDANETNRRADDAQTDERKRANHRAP
jgi:hypothetical protein